jgi:hypothetical protein
MCATNVLAISVVDAGYAAGRKPVSNDAIAKTYDFIFGEIDPRFTPIRDLPSDLYYPRSISI